ncbi:MAG: AAA family ATPase [Capsulimonadaceae bacterium]|nr:AAA family ATPase [Capsulimonadaceae bacterium]
MIVTRLPNLEIENFRAFSKLTIPTLGRINLIAGKNNVGKTTVLEALWLYANGGSAGSAIREILLDRRDLLEGAQGTDEVLYSLFNGRPHLVSDSDEIHIGTSDPEIRMSLRLEWFALIDNSNNPHTLQSIPQEFVADYDDAARWVVIRYGDDAPYRFRASKILDSSFTPSDITKVIPNQFVHSDGLLEHEVRPLWDEVQLTDSEQDIIETLRLIAPAVERVSLRTAGTSQSRVTPIVKLRGSNEVLPLRSVGDGMTRAFNLALALANARGGMLFVDEIENGLHYTVMPDIWRSLFQVALKLDVQVFATTHSLDCIKAFQEVAAEHGSQTGMLIRLEGKDGVVKAVEYDDRRLAIATEQAIEVR